MIMSAAFVSGASIYHVNKYLVNMGRGALALWFSRIAVFLWKQISKNLCGSPGGNALSVKEIDNLMLTEAWGQP